MDIGKVLSRAWEIIRTHKVLWIFGILASCGSRSGGGGGGSNFSSSNSGQGMTPPAEWQPYLNNLERSFQTIPQERWLLIGLLVVAAVLLLAVITWLVGLYGKAGLTVGTLRAEAGSAVSFRTVWQETWGQFDRVVALNFVLALPPVVLGLVFAFIAIATLGIGLLCLIPLGCLALPLSLAYAVFGDLANIALIKERLGVRASLERGWEVLSGNVGPLAVLALILIIGGFLVSLLLAVPFFIAAVPLLLGAINGDAMRNISVALICVVVALPFLILAGGIVQSYLQAAWTLAYAQLTAVPASKRIKST